MLGFFNNVEIIGVMSGNSTAQARVSNRPSHSLIYKATGESVYYFDGKQYHLKPGTLLYVPEGANYSFKKVSEDSTHRLVNFHADCAEAPSPQFFTSLDSESVSVILRQLEKNWRFEQNLTGKYERLSLLYKLLAHLTHVQNSGYTTLQKKELLAPAIDYLDKHIFDSDLKAAILPELCGMSGPTFRRVFASKFGVSPKKYIINQRLLQAKIILESGEYKNICEVSATVGYDDSLYFSKLFKSFYGASPSKY